MRKHSIQYLLPVLKQNIKKETGEARYAFIEREIMKQRQWKLQMMNNNNDMGNFLVVSTRKGVKRKLSDKNDDSPLGSDILTCKVKKGTSSKSSNVRVANWRKTLPEAKKSQH